MKNKYGNVPLPTEDEKNTAIRHIVSEGMKNTGFVAQLLDMYRALGFKCIFWDTLDCFVLSLLAFICTTFISFNVNPNEVAVFLFTVSPISYVILSISVQWKEHMNGLYELKMTCKYTIEKITAFRMLCFIVMGVPICVVFAGACIYRGDNCDYVHMLMISICSMFICAVIMMMAITKIRKPKLYLTVPFIWGAANIALKLIFKDGWNDFLMNISTVVAVVVTAICAIIYVAQIKKLILNNNTEDICYADS